MITELFLRRLPIFPLITFLGYALNSRTYYMLCFTPPMIELPVTGSRETAC
jgi:hypothetical protein